MPPTSAVAKAEAQLADAVADFYADPLGFVLFAYPWREPGDLEAYDGPDQWQREVLNDMGSQVRQRRFDGVNAVAAIREAVASGHGIGKSTLVAWLVDWIMSTRPHAQGTITANTYQQLASKTWAAVQRWTRLSLTGHWFEVTGDRMWHKAYKESWFCSTQTCKEENSESFAGQHAANSTSFYIFDEASAVPDKTFEVAEGGLTDGESMIFLFGNPTRSTGKFHRVTFGSERERWTHRSIDSRHCALPNKKQIEEWIADSDFVRVRVRGLPPRASDLQYIDSQRVYDAQRRIPENFGDEPLVVGVDVARGGMDSNVIWFRRGRDARSIPPIRIPGEHTRDSMVLVSRVIEVLNTFYLGRKPVMAFVDGTGIGGPIVDRCRQLGYVNVVEVQFGAKAPDEKQANMRAFIWSKMRDWLQGGAIPADPQLEADLTGPQYRHDRQDRLLLESKEEMKARGLSSPDNGDALALTFAQPVGPDIESEVDRPEPRRRDLGSEGWMA
jgi:hypothetical protein